MLVQEIFQLFALKLTLSHEKELKHISIVKSAFPWKPIREANTGHVTDLIWVVNSNVKSNSTPEFRFKIGSRAYFFVRWRPLLRISKPAFSIQKKISKMLRKLIPQNRPSIPPEKKVWLSRCCHLFSGQLKPYLTGFHYSVDVEASCLVWPTDTTIVLELNPLWCRLQY